MKNKLIYFLLLFLLPSYAFAQLEDIDSNKPIQLDPKGPNVCQRFNNKLLIFVDFVYFFKDCNLHLVNDVHLINTMIIDMNLRPLKMSGPFYASLKIGKNYTFENYAHDFHKEEQSALEVCEKYNNKIISMNDFDFYFIENCKKRKFKNYSYADKYNNKNYSLNSVSLLEFNLIPNGKDIELQDKNENIKELSEIDIIKKLPPTMVLCKNLNGKVAAFFESFYFVDKCVLHPISNFNMDLQIKAEEKDRIIDLSIEQRLGLVTGKEITSSEVISKIQ